MADIENTTRQAQDAPIVPFVEMLALGTDAFVEGQEARGAAQMLTSEQLPAQGDWAALEALGFVKGDPVPGDDLFVYATLPEGWEKRRTEHSLWTDIVDERGVKRVSIGYKAAFYDRWAQINVVHVGYDLSGDIIYGEGPVALPDQWAVLTDSEKVLVAERLRTDIAKNDEFIEKYGDSEGRYEAYNERSREGLKLIEASRG